MIWNQADLVVRIESSLPEAEVMATAHTVR